jgi:hypothetical protein
VIACIAKLMEHDIAGDPMTGLKWTRRTTAKVAAELQRLDIHVSDRTVARLLKQMGFALRVNHKKLSGACPENRDAQFTQIAEVRERFAARGLPLISIDTKKKELVGRFKNAGASWERKPVLVNDHDFRSDATGIAIPYGIYDLRANRGTVFVGNSRDTPEFAVDCVVTWWRSEGRQRHHNAEQLAILADGGGSNAANSRAFKYGLQTHLCNRFGLTVTVAHYPPGASKWNPIEHRLFSEISKNWAGHPLESYETILDHIQTTTTSTGLRVTAHLIEKTYEKGIKISNSQMRELAITKDRLLPKWNYTLRPA